LFVPIATVNPATGAVLREFPAAPASEVDEQLGRAAAAAALWRRVAPEDRARLLTSLAMRLTGDREGLARLATLEMGKTLKSARDEVTKCANACRHYAAHGPRMLADDDFRDKEISGTVRYDPLGVVLGVMPWNFPYWQVLRAAIPAMLAGNAFVLKHASNVPQCALALEELFAAASAPEGLFQTLLIPAGDVARVIADPRVAAVTVTGSERAGREIAAAAGAVTRKCVLELGGNDPFIVFADANVERAAEVGVAARMINNGQSCVCAKRFIVDESVADEFEAVFAARVKALVLGDPVDDTTDLGPLATKQGQADLAEQLSRTLASGARSVVEGGAVEGKDGWWFRPALLRDVPLDSPAAREELFGPVAPIFRVRGPDEAIALANDSSLGLGASVWTRSEVLANRSIAELDAGMVFVNAMVASDPRLPFGGVKGSGYGREVGLHGLREFVNVKTVRGSAHG
jgi:succinate-semialdehyde dehydrogenase/glutarate-semialdehyde dehydrogenase